MQVAGPFALGILARHETRLREQVFAGMKELAVKMEDVENKVFCKRPKRLFCIDIFLPAGLAVMAGNDSTAVQTVFLFTFWLVGHAKFFLKIGTKTAVHRLFMPFTKTIIYFWANNILMKFLLFPAALFFSLAAPAQYYYKDIVGTRESSDLIKRYIKNKVTRVVLTSYNAGNTRDEDFYVEQQFIPATRALTTTSRSEAAEPSSLTSYADEAGNIVRTVDSTDIISITTYTYNREGQLLSVSSSSSDSTGASTEGEQHLWEWKNGQASRMLRIKNRVDTTFVNFKLDDQNNVVEETETRRGVTTQPVFYYYNASRQLTDIVRFSKRANQLLPEYMFEYTEGGQVAQKITVPSNNSEYLIWRYQYSGRGLKTKEVIYNKQKKLTGKIEYQYTFGS
jgi:hypothetical protein